MHWTLHWSNSSTIQTMPTAYIRSSWFGTLSKFKERKLSKNLNLLPSFDAFIIILGNKDSGNGSKNWFGCTSASWLLCWFYTDVLDFYGPRSRKFCWVCWRQQTKSLLKKPPNGWLISTSSRTQSSHVASTKVHVALFAGSSASFLLIGFGMLSLHPCLLSMGKYTPKTIFRMRRLKCQSSHLWCRRILSPFQSKRTVNVNCAKPKIRPKFNIEKCDNLLVDFKGILRLGNF